MGASVRRDQLLRMLRRGRALTAEQLARDLGVSRRSLFRDLAALRERGFVIDGDAGRGGGIRLDPRSVLVSAQFGTGEIVALILSVAVSRSMPWIPFARLAEQALEKLEGALPRDRLRQLQRLLHRIWIGDPMDPGAVKNCGLFDKSFLVTFEHAFTARLALQFEYVDRTGASSTRIIEPHAMLLRAPLWYIVAWDIQKDASRLFRVDRIGRLRVVPDVGFGPRAIKYVQGACPENARR